MAISKIFDGRVIKYPSGSGHSTRPCPGCSGKLYCVFGYNTRLDKFITREFCCEMPSCGYYEDNMVPKNKIGTRNGTRYGTLKYIERTQYGTQYGT